MHLILFVCCVAVQVKHITGTTADIFLEYIQRNLPEGIDMSVYQVQRFVCKCTCIYILGRSCPPYSLLIYTGYCDVLMA